MTKLNKLMAILQRHNLKVFNIYYCVTNSTLYLDLFCTKMRSAFTFLFDPGIAPTAPDVFSMPVCVTIYVIPIFQIQLLLYSKGCGILAHFSASSWTISIMTSEASNPRHIAHTNLAHFGVNCRVSLYEQLSGIWGCRAPHFVLFSCPDCKVDIFQNIWPEMQIRDAPQAVHNLMFFL